MLLMRRALLLALPLVLAAQPGARPAPASPAPDWTLVAGPFLKDADPAQAFHLAIAIRASNLARLNAPPVALALDRLGAEALATSNYNSAFRLLARAISLRRGLELNEALDLVHSLDFVLDRRIASPSDTLHPRVEPLFAAGVRLSKPFPIRVWISDLSGRQLAPPVEDRIDSFAVLELRLPLARLPAGNYLVHFSLFDPEGTKPLVSAARPLDIDPGMPARIRALTLRLEKLVRAGAAGRGPRQAAALETIQYYTWLYGSALKTQVAAFHQRLHPFLSTFVPLQGDLTSTDPIRPARDLPLAEQLATGLEAGADPFAGLSGDFRLAYRSGVEQPYQPYRVFLPPGAAAKPLPLVFVLRPDTGDEGTLLECCIRNGENVLTGLARRRGYMLAAPEGLGPYSFFAGTAADDAHQVLQRVTTLFPAGPVLALGHSMGAMGALTLSLDKRFHFAGVAASAGYPVQRVDFSAAPDIPVLWRQSRSDALVSADEARRLAFLAEKYFKQFDYLELDAPDRWSLFESTLPEFFDFFDAVRAGAWKPSGRRIPLPSIR